MRTVGTKALGIRLPIINRGDDLINIILNSIDDAITYDGVVLGDRDIFGITESVVAKSQNNYATIDDIAKDIKAKFPDGIIGLVYPMPSRNRFASILKAISLACEKVYVLLQYPHDDVGNPIMLESQYDELKSKGNTGLKSASEFQKLTNAYKHPFTNIDYITMYENINSNIEVYLSDNPCDIFKFTSDVLNCRFHNIERTNRLLKEGGAKTLYSLCDILAEPVNGSGYNEAYGLLGSNIATKDSVKLFPHRCDEFVNKLQSAIANRFNIKPEVLIYGDGAYKDPTSGIWELADPVVAPAYTNGLDALPHEMKLKYIADECYGDTDKQDKENIIKQVISNKTDDYNEGTTPRKYYNLVGSLCDLISGSGDKGTPLVLIQGYFDDYSM